jgi:hypothetical protein
MTDNAHNPTEPTETTEPTAHSTGAVDATPRRRRPLIVGVTAGVLGLAVGAGGAVGASAIFSPDGHGSGRIDHSHDSDRHDGVRHGETRREGHDDGAYGGNQ